MIVSKVTVWLFLALNCFGVGVSVAAESLCSSGRLMIFSCRLDEEGNKIISICEGADPLGVDYLQGTDKKIDSKIVFTRENPLFRWVDAATYTTYFGFKQSGYSYVFGNPQETFGVKAFLEVSKAGGLSKTHRCLDNSYGDKNFDSPAIGEVADEVVRNNGFEFPP